MITGILFVKIIGEMEWAHEYNKINCERWDGEKGGDGAVDGSL